MAQRSTTYLEIPKPIRKKIENNYAYSNAFFYQVYDKSNTFLFWYYKQTTVNWFSYINGKLRDKGTFESNNGASGLSIFGTNNLLKAELDKFQAACPYALDAAMFGFIIKFSFEDTFVGREMTCLYYINDTDCFHTLGTNNFIANDFKKIRDLNYKITSKKYGQ
jgi:hypothetical protein